MHYEAMVNVNGRISDEREAVVPVFDHGFLYGEGVYETIRTYSGRPFLLDRHLRRLRTSAGMIALRVPLSDDEIESRIAHTVDAASRRFAGSPASSPSPPASLALPSSLSSLSSEWYIRLLLTRGVGPFGYDPAACPTPSVVVIVCPFEPPPPEAYLEGVSVALVSVMRNHPGALDPLIKSNNLLNNVLAMQQAADRGAFEGVMLNHRGELSECTTANIFVVRNEVALTPPLEAGLLAGITREFVFEIGEGAGVAVRDAILTGTDLLEADEAFLTSTTRELVPIVRVDDRPIGDGTPGRVTKRLLAAFRARALELTRQA